MEQNNLDGSQIYKNFIKKYSHLKKKCENLLKKFDLWKNKPCDTNDSFYNEDIKFPVGFSKFQIDETKEENYLDSEFGTTKNKFSFSELTYENVQDDVKLSDLFLSLGFRVIICTYYTGYSYENCTFSIENFDKKKLFIDNNSEKLMYLGYDKNNENEENIKLIVAYNEDTTVHLCIVLN